MIFSRIERALQPHWCRIYNHPFNQSLYSGTLSIHAFYDFLKQDKLYLFEFSRCLNYLGKKINTPLHREILLHLSCEAEKTHEKLHDKYLSIPSQIKFFSSNNPVTKSTNEVVAAYIRHLHHTTQTNPTSVAVASLVPCFYIYSTLGLRMQQKGIEADNPYRLWIESYSNKEFLSDTQLAIQLLNKISTDENKAVDPRFIIQSFMKSVSFEIAFWDSVYVNKQFSGSNSYAIFSINP